MRHLPPERAWWLIGCFVVAFDAITPPGTTLSEKMDEWIDEHPFAARAAVVLVAAHLVNAIPPRLDPIHQAFVGVGTIKTRASTWCRMWDLNPRPRFYKNRTLTH